MPVYCENIWLNPPETLTHASLVRFRESRSTGSGSTTGTRRAAVALPFFGATNPRTWA